MSTRRPSSQTAPPLPPVTVADGDTRRLSVGFDEVKSPPPPRIEARGRSTAATTPDYRRSFALVPWGDSYMAYGANAGITRPSATFIAWPGVVLYEVSSGQADASGNFGATTDPNQWQNGFQLPIYGIGNGGHTTTVGSGILMERLMLTAGYTSNQIRKQEGSAHAGKLAAEFVIAQDPQQPTRYLWSGLTTVLAAAVAGDRVVAPTTQGGNDLIAQFTGSYLVPATPGFWEGKAALTASYLESNLDYLLSIKPAGVQLEVPVLTYPNLLVDDGVPLGYPPVGGEPGAFRCVWLTNGFGFYNQATGDLATEASRWALTFDPSGGIVWSFYFNYLQNLALAVDPVARVFGGGAGSYQAISNDPTVWIASVQNVTQTTVNRVFHMYAEEQRTVCEKYAVGGPKHHPEFSVVFVDMRDAMSPDPAQSSYPIRYRSAPKSRFVEGIHLNATGWREYFDRAMERWFPRSAFQDLRETSWKV